MRDLLRRFQREAEIVRRDRLPTFDRLRRRDAVKRIIDLGRGKALGVKRQHLRGRQIFGIKMSLPLFILKTRSAHPKLHCRSYETRKTPSAQPATVPIT